MSSKCAFVALPSSDVSGGLLCTTCGETSEKEPICPKQRQTMTTNNPVQRFTDMGSETICPINNMRESGYGDYVLYADYKALQTECKELMEALSALRGCIMETRGPDAHSALELADAALAAYHNGASHD